MACRNLDLAEKAAADIRTRVPKADIACYQLDLSSRKSIEEFVNKIKFEEKQVDVLVNNGAVLTWGQRQETDDGYEMMFAVNYLGTVYLSILLMDFMKKTSKDPRIISVSSLGHLGVPDVQWDDLQSKNSKEFQAIDVYKHSKLLLMLFVRELRKRATGIRVYAVDPGMSPTDLARDFPQKYRFVLEKVMMPFMRTVDQAGDSIVWTVTAGKESLAEDVYYWCDGVERRMSSTAASDERSDRLWRLSCHMLDLPLTLS